MKYVAIRNLRNILALNVRFRELYAAVTALQEQVALLSGKADIPNCEDDIPEITEPVITPIEEKKDPAIVDPPIEFDWKASEDVDALKEFAASKDIEIHPAVKRVDTIKEKIASSIED